MNRGFTFRVEHSQAIECCLVNDAILSILVSVSSSCSCVPFSPRNMRDAMIVHSCLATLTAWNFGTHEAEQASAPLYRYDGNDV